MAAQSIVGWAMAREPSTRGPSGGEAFNGATKGAGEGAGQRRVRAYSRLVSWMKVVLPLAAVAVMSAMFFSAQMTSDLTEIFTAEELVTLGAGLRLDNPRFAGVTEQGEPFAIRADNRPTRLALASFSPFSVRNASAVFDSLRREPAISLNFQVF